MNKIYAGWYISNNCVRVVLASKNGRGLKIVSSFEKPVLDTRSDIGPLIDEIISEKFDNRFPSWNVLCFPVGELYKEKISVPVKNKSEMVKMISFELENKALMYEKMCFFAQEMSTEDGTMNYIVFGIKKDFLQDFAKRLNVAEQDLHLCVAEDAIFKSLKNDFFNGQYNSLINIQNNNVSVFVEKNKQFVYGESLTLKNSDETSTLVGHLLYSMRRVLEDKVKRIVLFGAESLIGEAENVVKENGINTVSVKELDTQKDLKTEFLPAFGALEGFLKKDFKYIRIASNFAKNSVFNKINSILLLVLIGAFMLLTSKFIVYNRLNAETKMLSRQINKETGAVIGKNKPVVNPVKQVKTVLEEKSKHSVFYAKRIIGAPEFLIIIDRSLTDIHGIEIESMFYERSGLRIKGKSSDFDVIQEWKNKIAKIKQVSRVDIENAMRDGSSGTIDFTLAIREKE